MSVLCHLRNSLSKRYHTHYAIRRAKEKGSIISYDPNYRASLWKDEETAKKLMRSLVPYVDIMKISDEETKLLTDKESPEEATEILFRKGVKIVAVTLGSDGAYLYCKRRRCTYSGICEQSGGHQWGRRFLLGSDFLYCISKAGKRPEAFTMDELKEYVRFGNAVASLCVERKGAIPCNAGTCTGLKKGWDVKMDLKTYTTGIQHIGIPTNDIEKTIAFYPETGI